MTNLFVRSRFPVAHVFVASYWLAPVRAVGGHPVRRVVHSRRSYVHGLHLEVHLLVSHD